MSDLGSPRRLRAWAQDLRIGRDCMGADMDLETAADRIEELEAAVVRFEREAIKWRAKYYTARREALEEAARVAENYEDWDDDWDLATAGVAAAIRKLMEKGE